jgi:two-component system, LytTR family, response regulator
MNPLKVIIIDDEPDCVRLLELQLNRHCPNVTVIGSTSNSEDGLIMLLKTPPDLLYLDIEMPHLNGFDLLEKVGDLTFQVVFTTAYDRYAVRAFKFSALDYLLKPIDPVELKATVEKAALKVQVVQQQLDLLKQQLLSTRRSSKIALPQLNGFIIADIEQIIYCESDSNYTRFHMKNNEQYLICRSLGEVENLLEGYTFFRPHKQFLVNTEEIKKVIRDDGTILELSNGAQVPVSRQKVDSVKQIFNRV